MTAAEALTASGDRADVVTVGRYRWAAVRGQIPETETATRVKLIFPAGLDRRDGASTGRPPDELRALPHAEARDVIAENLTREPARVLHTDPARLDRRQRLEELGVDSLMAAELIAVLRNTYGIEIPPMELVRKGGTINDIAEMVHLRLDTTPAVEGGGRCR
ncbi:acyl carrier protein [Actinomadura sp. KC06]|uniref:acyl carrier protein n=1 Tax=Actinomadura sp. KC06 TaxID=2530369 RepID=UPI001404958A|nr:acyl carrier protein [Actinomadura sp. KC06]